ncbi:MAG TPA: hypothetical protein GX513_05005 [Firmicutes bacterium]|nr:hypothetical protein [Bacillota bacterium]
MIHPYHPLSGQEFELVTWCQAWCEDRVFFEDEQGQVRSLPASWTDIKAPDPFVALAAGRSIFRLEDLRRLVDLVRELTHATQGGEVVEDHVKEIMP